MSTPKFDPERVIPRLKDQRAQERQNRALAFAGITHTVCGREILPLTPGHRLELQLVRNAFAVVGEMPSLRDVFVFLWVASPDRAKGIIGRWRQYRLRREVRRFNLRRCTLEIFRYLQDQYQDVSSGSGEGRDNSAWIHWMAMDAEFWLSIHGGFTLEEYRRTPYLVLQQLYRAWQVNHPDMERLSDGKVITRDAIFRNASDQLVSEFHRQNRERIKAWHLAQKTRRN